jgi:glycosyltransferase involved in cell wall biosynthesis
VGTVRFYTIGIATLYFACAFAHAAILGFRIHWHLIENKGCASLLKAIALLPTTTQQRTTLWIVGDGDEKARLEQLAESIGISDKVHFFGNLSHDELPDIYAAADIVAVPSKPGDNGETEGQGVVVLEAFAARACVLATSVGGITSMVRDRVNGVLVPPDNPQALANALLELLGAPELRNQLAENGHTDVRKYYSWTSIAGKFESLYRTVVKS